MRNNKILVIVIGVVTILSACETKKNYQYTEGKIYGTFYHISYNYPDDLQKDIREEMEKVNASLSMFNPHSVISKINRGESDSTDLLFREMYIKAGQIHRETKGAFDITVAPLVNAWGFGFKTDSFPSAEKIDSILRYVGMEKLTLEGDRLVKQVQGIEIDASSIAKGLGTDLVADYFDRKGITDYMVEIGGEIRIKGMSTKGKPWRIGIDKPIDDATGAQREIEMVVELTSGALATSGNYRNFYIHDGKKYAHTINPRTGYPVQQDILSASVYTDSCMKADAYATAFMVLGLESAKEIVNSNPMVEACFIYEQDGQMKKWISPGFEKLIDRK